MTPDSETHVADQAARQPEREARPSLAPGTVLLDRFEIVRSLGSGGMGEVYEAHDRELGRIALKIIRPEIANEPRTLARFRQEVQLARRVSGPNVCRIHELFTAPRSAENALVFLTMEFLEGPTLSDRIKEHGALPPSEAETIALQLCAGLETIHASGIVHRDFKPRNILLAKRQGVTQAVITDFGLARQLRLSAAAAAAGDSITLPGAIAGTPPYMAPEQFDPDSPATPATDIYALGIVLYQMITAALPFPSKTLSSAAAERTRPFTPPSSLRPDAPAHWNSVVARCLAYDPPARFQSAAEVAEALSLAHAPSRRSREQPSTRPRVLKYAAAIAALLAVIVIGAISFLRYRHAYRPPSPEAQHWYEEGAAALRDGTYLKAIRALERSTSLDRDFVLAHARLADAWNALDFTGNAQKEMLLASSPDLARNLPALDAQYVDAVRSTLTLDFTRALLDYRNILAALPSTEKAYGYVDLGRVYERAGHLTEAIAAYSRAAALAPENPAPFVHLGILESRQQQTAAADTAFNRAETLYRASSNLEGLAEIDYQRGNAANTAGQLAQARAFLEKSLQSAQAIPSVQLEIRALTRLSTTAYLSGNTDKSIELAQQAIDLAQNNQIEYWAIDGFIRLGTAYVIRQDYAQAERYFEQALHLATQGERPRLEANANLMLASVRDLQGQPHEVIPLATAALDYYQHNGFVNESGDALALITRAQKDANHFTLALRSASKLLEIANNSGSPVLKLRAESTLGEVLLDLERYPDALPHVEAALDISRQVNAQPEYYALNVAEVLWRLGRYADAERLVPLARDNRMNVETSELLAGLRLSQRRYADALRYARQAQSAGGSATRSALNVEAVAQCHLDSPRVAQAICARAVAEAERAKDLEAEAKLNLTRAEIYIAENAPDEAKSAAAAAYDFFSNSGQLESEWRSLFFLSLASQRLGDPAASKQFAAKALDILVGFEHNWSTLVFRTYIGRPDLAGSYRQLTELSGG